MRRASRPCGRPFARTVHLALLALLGVVLLLQAAAAAGRTIAGRAVATYVIDGSWQATETAWSDVVVATIDSGNPLQLTREQSVRAAPGGLLVVPHVLTNAAATTFRYTVTLRVEPDAGSGSGPGLDQVAVVHDVNGNGVQDAGDRLLPLDTRGALALAPGAQAHLLVVARVSGASAGSGAFRLRLGIEADASPLPAVSNVVTVSVQAGPAVAVSTSADVQRPVAVGASIVYSLRARNDGSAPAVGTPVQIDGTLQSVLLLRWAVPAGTHPVPGSLAADDPGALLLHRLAGDPPDRFRTGVAPMSAVELAVAWPAGLGVGQHRDARFAAQVRAGSAPVVRHEATARYGDGRDAFEAMSNEVLLTVATARLGVALSAVSLPVGPSTAAGAGDDVQSLGLSLRLRNYGGQPLTSIRLRSLLAGPQRFGTYTRDAAPGVGQYTVAAGSLVVKEASLGTSLAAEAAYRGDDASSDLLAPGALMPAGGTALVQLTIRFNPGNRTDTFALGAQALAAIAQPGAVVESDDSVDGDDPDPDGDADPRNNASPTLVRAGRQALAVTRVTTTPTPVAGLADTFDYELRITVRNTGAVPLHHVRVADNLGCTLPVGTPASALTSWQVMGPPVVRHGVLRSAGTLFTGRVPCDPARLAADDPLAAFPAEMALSLTDGTRSLLPGQLEEVTVPLRVLRSATAPRPASWLGTAHAAAFDANLIGVQAIRAAAFARSATVLADPGGVVYRSDDRSPVPGAVVTLRRMSCSSGVVGAITPAQLAAGPSADRYRFLPDGGVSITTQADGAYAFPLGGPALAAPCDYALSVAPPAGLVWPSRLMPPVAGPAAGGAVQPQSTAPAAGQPAPYHLTLTIGPGHGPAWNNHLPLDPAGAAGTVGLVLRLTADKASAELADVVTYRLTLANRGAEALPGFRLTSTLPPGLAYVPGSAQVMPRGAEPALRVEPEARPGAPLTFDLPQLQLDGGSTVTVRYRARVGVGALQGDGVHRARGHSGTAVSNEAAHRLQVQGGVLGDEAILVGKVFLDCNRNGRQDADEPGVPGVRVLLDTGSAAWTDPQGRWSLYGLKPQTRVIKLDPATLPKGARPMATSTRSGASPGTRFADLRKGELHQADFALADDGRPDPGAAGCGAADGGSVAAEVQARRSGLATASRVEGEDRLARPLDPQGRPMQPPDARALPAAGRVGAAPGDATASAAVTPAPAPAPPAAASPLHVPVPLDQLVRSLQPAPGFVDLVDGQVLPAAATDVRVKGRPGHALVLHVNGQPVSERRVGMKSELPSSGVAAWQYVGVDLQPGPNVLRLQEQDAHGQVTAVAEVSVVAPGALSRLRVELPGQAVADDRSRVRVRVDLLDERGVPVTARLPLTLDASLGRWAVADLNPHEPGTQVFIEGGTASFELIAPSTAGTSRVTVTSGTLVQRAEVAFLPDLRPLVGAGIFEGLIDLRQRGRTVLSAPRPRDAFESELQLMSATSANGRLGAAARASFHFKGAIKGDYLLSTAYDSDKAARERLFRDIQPDEYYPVYGDGSVRSFDAQSTGRFFVRVDQGRSYLLYGDFTTASPAEGRQLTQFSRSLTGLQLHHQGERVATTAFASRGTLGQVVDEFAADGTSGPYALREGINLYANSEKVELVVHDRRQPQRVLSVQPLARFADYEIEPAGGRILFKGPVASTDEDFNPRRIRITYEVDGGGPAFWVAGGEVQVQLTDALRVGAQVARDANPAKTATLAGLTAQARLGDKSVANLELARTHTAASGDGTGARVDLRIDDGALKLRAQATRTSDHFDNPAAFSQKGRQDASVNAAYSLGPAVSLTAEAVDTQDRLAGRRNSGLLLGARSALGDSVQVEGGIRVARQTAAVAPAASGSAGPAGSGPAPDSTDLHTVRVRVNVQPPAVPAARAFVEAEQDVGDRTKRLLAVGGSWQFGPRTRIFGRYEALSSLGNPYQLGSTEHNNVAALGLESSLAEGQTLFSEWRLRNNGSAHEQQLASGARHRWALGPGLNLGAGLERTAALGGVSGQASTALTTTLDYTAPGLRVDGRLELRRTGTTDAVLNSLGLAWKLGPDWSLLARSVAEGSLGRTGQAADSLRLRQQLGLAYRPAQHNRWQALLRYEHRLEDQKPAAPAPGTDAGRTLSRTHIVSSHLSVQPWQGLVLNGRLAGRHHTLGADGLKSGNWAGLMAARALWDLSPRWDVGLQVVLHEGQGRSRQAGAGLELGYQVADDLWLSLGFNAFDLRDPAFTADAEWSPGVYVRVRYKFDEGLLR